MSLRILPDLEQGSSEWHDQRRGMVTASVVGQLITTRTLSAIDYACPACASPENAPCRSKVVRAGQSGAPIKTLHPERTEVAVARRDTSPLVIEVADNDTSRGLTALLAGERISGNTDQTWISADMWRGIEDEPRARDAYAAHFKVPVTQVGFMVNDDFGFEIGYSPDGLVGEDGLIEVKSRIQKRHVQTVVADEVPAENMAQIQCGLLVSGREWCDYVSYCGGMHLWTKRVTPDERWFHAIGRAVNRFERAAEEMADKFLSGVVGMPLTERVANDLGLEF